MPEPFEIRAEPDSGWRIAPDGGGVEDWQGYRICYRPLGTRGRFQKFLLEFDEAPSISQLQAICAAHERGDTNLVLAEVSNTGTTPDREEV